jgi:uncharacterized damage-inducible protein DinB
MNAADIRFLFAYHEWATDRQLTAIRRLTEEQLHRHLGGSFPTIYQTLLHLVGADDLWITRLTGKEAPVNMLREDDFPTLEDVERQLGATRQKWKNYLQQLDDGKLQQPFTYRNLRGQEVTLTLWHILHHVANHSTYHHGQITSMLRQVGVTPPGVDALLFYIEHHRL